MTERYDASAPIGTTTYCVHLSPLENCADCLIEHLTAERDTLRTALADTLRERDALEQERDAALLALSALCESCGGGEPHTMAHCTAHLKATLDIVPGLELAARDAAHYREAYVTACNEREVAIALLHDARRIAKDAPLTLQRADLLRRIAAFLAAHPEGKP